jgi:hypothetical protein
MADTPVEDASFFGEALLGAGLGMGVLLRARPQTGWALSRGGWCQGRVRLLLPTNKLARTGLSAPADALTTPAGVPLCTRQTHSLARLFVL